MTPAAKRIILTICFAALLVGPVVYRRFAQKCTPERGAMRSPAATRRPTSQRG